MPRLSPEKMVSEYADARSVRELLRRRKSPAYVRQLLLEGIERKREAGQKLLAQQGREMEEVKEVIKACDNYIELLNSGREFVYKSLVLMDYFYVTVPEAR